jgi:hypothetical protein
MKRPITTSCGRRFGKANGATDQALNAGVHNSFSQGCCISHDPRGKQSVDPPTDSWESPTLQGLTRQHKLAIWAARLAMLGAALE